MLDALAATIQKVCCEFTCKCTGGDAHSSAISILEMLGNYSWDAKVVIALAAFAVTYGELWLVMLLSDSNPLARSVAVLKQTPEISEIKGVLKAQFAPLNELIKVMVDVAKSLMEFRMLPSKYISPEDAPLATSVNQVALATYWTVRSVVAAGAQIATNFGLGGTTSATEAWDLSSLAHKEKSLHDHLVQRLHLCYEFIEEKKREEAFNNLVLLFKTSHKDIVRVLKPLIYAKDDIKPLVQISTKKRVGNILTPVIEFIQDPFHQHHQHEVKQVHVDVLRGKTVLLFISDLDVIEEELIVLDKMYKEAKKGKNGLEYEIVWLPIVDRNVTWTKEHETKFKGLQYKMPWYTLYHPSLLDVSSIRFIKEVWGFAKKPMLVSLDQFGKVVSDNALHMILIWGNLAYPFTTTKEEDLWKRQTWRLDFVMDAIHPEFPKWMSQGDTHVCLFGGEDIEWIRKFATSMKEHSTKAGIKIELVYVGKHNAKVAVKKIMEVINLERLAHTLPDLTQVWYFWTRLESMLYSKMHHGKNVDNDTIIKEVMSLLSFDGGDQGWGFIGSGSKNEIVKGKGDVIVSSFSRIKEWDEKSKKVGFLVAIWEFIQSEYKISSSYHCNRLVLPSIEGAGVPKVVTCADCGRPMDKYILYRCCTG